MKEVKVKKSGLVASFSEEVAARLAADIESDKRRRMREFAAAEFAELASSAGK